MEITNGAQEVLTRAEMLRESRGTETLCTEDILHGLLWLALYGGSEPELGAEAASTRAFLQERLADPAGAMHELERLSQAGGAGFTPADAVLGRAGELCGANDLDAGVLCRAVLEAPDSVIRELCEYGATVVEEEKPVSGGNLIFNFEAGDDIDVDMTSLDEDEPEASEQLSSGLDGLIISAMSGQSGRDTDRAEQSDGDAVMQEMLRLIAGGGAEKPESDRSEKERREREERERREREERERREREERERRERKKREHKKRRTKLGLFTYRGGKASAAIQYFLFGLIVPFVLLCLLEAATGILTGDRIGSVLILFAFVILWGYYLLRGVNRLIGFASEPAAHFLNAAQDAGTVLLLENVISLLAFAGSAPLWLRAAGSVGALAALIIGIKRFDGISDKGGRIKAVLFMSEKRGTFSRLILQYALKIFLLAMVVYALVHTFALVLPLWLVKTLWILGFFTAWIFFFNFYDCLGMRAELEEYKYTAHIGLIKYFEAAHILMTPAELVILLCLLFGWFPLKLWLTVVLSVWSVLAIIASFSAIEK